MDILQQILCLESLLRTVASPSWGHSQLTQHQREEGEGDGWGHLGQERWEDGLWWNKEEHTLPLDQAARL